MRRSLVLVLVAFVLSVAACSGGSGPLAVVNGQEITLDDMVDLNPNYDVIDQLEQDSFRDDLGLFVLLGAIETTARTEFGIEVSDGDVDAFLADPPEERAATVAGWQTGVVDGQMTDGEMRTNAKSLLVRDAVTAALVEDPEALNEIWEGSPQVFASACVRHILTQSEEEATAAFDRIAAGEDFAAVADDVSIDTSTSGGLLADPATGECDVPLSVFVEQFAYEAAVAPLGEVTGPFFSDFGWHIILVEERTAPASVDEIRADLDEFLSDDLRLRLITPWLNDAIDAADVEIDPSIGTWSETGSGILPAGEGDPSGGGSSDAEDAGG